MFDCRIASDGACRGQRLVFFRRPGELYAHVALTCLACQLLAMRIENGKLHGLLAAGK